MHILVGTIDLDETEMRVTELQIFLIIRQHAPSTHNARRSRADSYCS
jgi:hypothetical protein